MMMDWGMMFTGFGLGTVKFVFAHWIVFGTFSPDSYFGIVEIFVSVTAGAWISMSAFYFASSFFMKRARVKRLNAIIAAEKKGVPYKPKKAFTWMNRTIVKIKRSIGIYGVTFIAPLFLSIPIGSVICAKFYGNQRKTFPLMLLSTSAWSALMCLWIYAAI